MYYDNLTMLTDFYELTMMQGYFTTGMGDKRVVFDLYYRENPCGNGFAIAAGLQQAIEYIEGLNFSEDDISYLRERGCFTEDFLERLRHIRFTGDIHAVPEGTVVFPDEPLLRVSAPIFEAQLLETALLNIINHQSLIATNAARICYAAKGDAVLEFGLRRAQGPDAGIYGARAAIIGGCAATSNTLAAKMFAMPVSGTMAHSWVMSFPDELTAFRKYAEIFPQTCILLVDTYDTLKSGVPNAIRVFGELRARGVPLKNYGIRLDSGDFAYLSKKARVMLDAAGFDAAAISASGDMDANIIQSLKVQGAKINVWGVGTRLITSMDCPAFGGVYKLAAEENDGRLIPKIKLSENPAKVTTPGMKKVYRLTDPSTGKIRADLITLEHESIDESKPLTIFDPHATWKRMTLQPGEFAVRELLAPVFLGGERVYDSPDVMAIREYSLNERETLWDEHKRLVNPHPMYVDLSQERYDLKQSMINTLRGDKA